MGDVGLARCEYDFSKVWFGLCCLMTLGLNKDIQCHV